MPDTIAIRLVMLLASRGQLSVGEVAEILRYTPSVISRQALRLERDGLVARCENVFDRRRTELTITDLGRRLLAEERKSA